VVEPAGAAFDRRRSRNIDRTVNFSDGVVAIAATLLVLPLAEMADEVDTDRFADIVREVGPRFVPFVLSFVVIYRFWLVHRRLYAGVVDATNVLVWLNCAWLIGIVFLPFPTELVGRREVVGPAAYGLYIGTMLFTTLVTLISQWYLSRRPALRPDATPEEQSVRPSLLVTLAMAVALVVAVAVPAIGLWSLLVLFLQGPIERWLRRPTR
jgi:uncharacterized membrane protein